MKKKLLMALTLGAVMSLSTTAFAANPFELIPTNNWTYDAIGNLVQGGVFEGYRDVNFNKTQSLTRYEMATFVAKAMANESKANAEQKASIDKLSTEFKLELTNLGVYAVATAPTVAPATSILDKTQVSGQYRIRYQNNKMDVKNGTSNSHVLQGRILLNTTTTVNDNWKVNITGESYKNFYTDAGYKNGTFGSAWGNKDKGTAYNGSFDVTILNAEGKIAGADVTIGKFNNTIGSGLMFDDYVTGIQVEFGNKLKTKLAYSEADSNISGNAAGGNIALMSKVINADFSYDLNKATTLGASFQNWTSKTAGVDNMNVYELSMTSKLNKDLSAYASFDKTSADDNNKAYLIGLKYKGADKSKPGSYGAWIDYESFQQNTAIDTTNWMNSGQKGIALGFDYIPEKNMKWVNVFLRGKAFANNDLGQNEGQVQNFFRTQVYFYF